MEELTLTMICPECGAELTAECGEFECVCGYWELTEEARENHELELMIMQAD